MTVRNDLEYLDFVRNGDPGDWARQSWDDPRPLMAYPPPPPPPLPRKFPPGKETKMNGREFTEKIVGIVDGQGKVIEKLEKRIDHMNGQITMLQNQIAELNTKLYQQDMGASRPRTTADLAGNRSN